MGKTPPDTANTKTPVAKMKNSKNKPDISPLLQKVLKKSAHKRKQDNSQLMAAEVKIDDDKVNLNSLNALLQNLKDGENLMDRKAISTLFSKDSFAILTKTSDLSCTQLVEIIRRCYEGPNKIMLNFIYKLITDCLVSVKVFKESSGDIDESAVLLHACVGEICSNVDNQRNLFRCMSHQVETRVECSEEKHQNLLSNLLHISHALPGSYKEYVRSLMLSMLMHFEKKLSFGKNSMEPLIDVYMDFLFKDVLQKLSGDTHEKVNPNEAKIAFSFYCRKLKDFVHTPDLKYLPFVYVAASSIHSSFIEHLVRILWDSFKLDHSLMSLHWLVSFVCDTNLVMKPLVQDLMRHISLFLCKILRKAEAFCSPKKSMPKSSESSPEQFEAKQAFIFGFYALVEVLVRFSEDLTASDDLLAFVRSLRFDKFICSTLQPLAFLPKPLVSQFKSLTVQHGNVFPNIRLFLGESSAVSKHEKKDLTVTRTRVFQSFGLQRSKWAVDPLLYVLQYDAEKDLNASCVSSTSPNASLCSMDVTEHDIDDDEEDELMLYRSLNTAAAKAVANWLI